ncbi:MAG: SDR family oxidoreductase [Xanthobacteraceae bacterium]|nr:SDR family oxidoreductase [Xanthobacteraceae bacterium]
MIKTTRKLALITGASAGIGKAFAWAYAGRGFDVALVARRKDRLEILAAQLSSAHNIDAFAIPADLSIPEAQAPIMAALSERGREVDVLVNNAGFGIAHDYLDVPWSKQRNFLMTMAVAPCALAYAVIPGMCARGCGRIINIASIAGFAPGVAGNTLYPGVKGLMIKFSQALDSEYRAKGLKITALCPGFTQTEFAEEAGIQHIIDKSPRAFSQTADQVVEIAIRGNENGRVIVIPGWHNKIAVAVMRALPEPLVRAAINAGAAKYRLKD